MDYGDIVPPILLVKLSGEWFGDIVRLFGCINGLALLSPNALFSGELICGNLNYELLPFAFIVTATDLFRY